MDYAKSFTFVFDDKDWLRKLGMASLVLFVSMLLLVLPGILFIMGYQVTVARNVYNGQEHPLPDPENFGEIFREGLSFFSVAMVYFLPLWLVMCVFVGLIAATGGAAESGSDALGATLGVFSMLVYCLYFILIIGLGLLLQAAMVQYVRKGTFSACMKFGKVWQLLKNNIADYLLIMVATIAAQVIAQLALGISAITICGPLLFMFPALLWQTAVPGHLFGQLAAQGGNDSMNKEAYYDNYA